MALRAFLVILVASLGFQLPSDRDLASWTRTGRNWADARLADLSRFRIDLAGAFNGPDEAQRPEATSEPVELASTRSDLAFEAVVEKLASDFSGDLAAIEEARPIVEGAIAARPEPIEAGRVVGHDPAIESPKIEPVLTSEAGSRVERIASAIRMTRQAMDAWVSIVGPPTAESSAPSY